MIDLRITDAVSIHRNLFRVPQVGSSLLENPLLRRLRRGAEGIGPPLEVRVIKRLARPLSELLLALPVAKCDAVIPVPLRPGKLREREFNQSALLGLQLSQALKIPLLLDSLKKVREIRLQTEVSGKERHTNLTRAYAVSGDISGKRLLLVDDVITTGATVRECAATLKRAGVSKYRGHRPGPLHAEVLARYLQRSPDKAIHNFWYFLVSIGFGI